MQHQSSSVSNKNCNVVVIDANASVANDGAHSNTEQSGPAVRGGASKTLKTSTTGWRPSLVALFPVPSLNCQETNESFLSTDPTHHVVVCLMCNKEMPSSQYTPKQFVDACLHSKHASKSGSNPFKKHTEFMYVSH
jgi:hypothetical protein